MHPSVTVIRTHWSDVVTAQGAWFLSGWADYADHTFKNYTPLIRNKVVDWSLGWKAQNLTCMVCHQVVIHLESNFTFWDSWYFGSTGILWLASCLGCWDWVGFHSESPCWILHYHCCTNGTEDVSLHKYNSCIMTPCEENWGEADTKPRAAY